MLFKGGLHLEHLSVLRALAVDKTGTLTQGKPVVTDFIVRDGVERDMALAILAGIESQSNHPLPKLLPRMLRLRESTHCHKQRLKIFPAGDKRNDS